MEWKQKYRNRTAGAGSTAAAGLASLRGYARLGLLSAGAVL